MLEELLQTIFFNITIILGVFLLMTVVDFSFYTKGVLTKIFMGGVIGMATIITMINGFQLISGVVYDARSVIIGVAAFFFPWMTSFVATVIAMVYRVSLGGIGALPGSLSILSAFIVGIIWREKVQKRLKVNAYFQFYLLGFVIHVFVTLSQLSLPYPRNIENIKLLGPVFLILYPIIVMILGIFMKNHHDRLNVQKQLVESESRLKTIFNDSPISMILHDCETGEIVGANNAALALFQADSLTQLNEALWYDDSPYSAEDALRYIHDALQEDQNFIWRSKTKSGNYLYERVLLRPIMINDVKRILSASIDITESKYQEEKNRDLENQLQLLVAEMPVGLVLFEAVYDELNIPIDFTYLNVNQSFEDFSELKAEDIIGKTISDALPNSEKSWIQTFAQVLSTGQPTHYEEHSKRLNKYYSVKAYSPKQNQVAVLFEDITQRKLMDEKILFASKHDYLTSLPNRRFFDEKIREMDQPQNYPLVVSMMDIDGLKLINDTLGHFVGDQAIIAVAKQLQVTFGEHAFVARTGGDEFMIVCANTLVSEFKQKRNEMIETMSKIKIQGVDISLSFGIAIKSESTELIQDIIIKSENDMYANKVLHGQSARNQIIVTLFDALKNKYEEEKIHSSRVSQYCSLMGECLGLSEGEKLELELAGRMHDIGKISIPDTILRKPGKLNDEEWNIMRNHTTNGYQILRSADQYSRLAEYALSHHERVDGKGYPQGLKGEEIPLFSRIIAICDAYEAMTSDRQYRKAMTSQEAVKEIIRCAGTQFDEKLVKIFIEEVIPQMT